MIIMIQSSSRTALVTDSTCDLPLEWIKQYDITVVPLTIISGDQQYLDGVDLTPKEFYHLLSKETLHPTRSQPAPEAFLKAYQHTNSGLPRHVTVLHYAVEEEAQALAEYVWGELSPNELFVSIVSPVLGVHTGPRAIALCGYAG